MHLPGSSIVFFIVCGIPIIVAYFLLIRKVKGFFLRTLGITLFFVLVIIALLIITFISKDFQAIS